jgi:hypothetical protein
MRRGGADVFLMDAAALESKGLFSKGVACEKVLAGGASTVW